MGPAEGRMLGSDPMWCLVRDFGACWMILGLVWAMIGSLVVAIWLLLDELWARMNSRSHARCPESPILPGAHPTTAESGASEPS